MQGVDLNPLGIYPPVEFPVPRGTGMLSPLLSWDHSQSWNLPNPQNFLSGTSGQQSETVFEVFPGVDGKDHYLTGIFVFKVTRSTIMNIFCKKYFLLNYFQK